MAFAKLRRSSASVKLYTALAAAAALLLLVGRDLYLAHLTEPLIPEDYHSAPLELFTLNGVSFYHIKGSFNHKWVSTALNEKLVSAVFEEVTNRACPSGGLIVDVGANTGIYGLYSAARGCRSVMLDPQPQCQRAILAAMEANGFREPRVRLVPFAATLDKTRIRVTNQSQCLTSLSLAPKLNERHAKQLAGAVWYEVPTVRLDEVLQGPPELLIHLMKVDVEGAEYTVLRSAWRLFEQRRIKALTVEVSPPWWSQFGVSRTDVATLFGQLWDLGYTNVTVLEALHGSKPGPTRLLQRWQVSDFIMTYPYKQVDLYITVPSGG